MNKIKYIECNCQLPEHLMVLRKWDDNDNTFCCFNIQMDTFPILTRIKNAFKYIFRLGRMDYHWAECLIDEESAKDIIKFLQENINGNLS